MKSIKELYRIGTGPSSSHTMGPRKAAPDIAGKASGSCRIQSNIIRKFRRYRQGTHDQYCHHRDVATR